MTPEAQPDFLSRSTLMPLSRILLMEVIKISVHSNPTSFSCIRESLFDPFVLRIGFPPSPPYLSSLSWWKFLMWTSPREALLHPDEIMSSWHVPPHAGLVVRVTPAEWTPIPLQTPWGLGLLVSLLTVSLAVSIEATKSMWTKCLWNAVFGPCHCWIGQATSMQVCQHGNTPDFLDASVESRKAGPSYLP